MGMTTSLGKLLLLSTVAAALLIVAGCGGNKLAEDPAAVLASATLPPAGPNASTLALEFSPTTGGEESGALGGLLGGPIAIEASSEGDQASGVVADARVLVGPATLNVNAMANADGSWIQVGDTWYELGGPLPLDFGSVGGAIGSVSESIADPRAIAVEDIGGIECDRISGTLDPAGLGADQLGALLGGLPINPSALLSGDAAIDVWVARDDDIIRRIRIDAGGEAGAGPATAGGRLLLDLTVLPGEVQEVTPPADAQPIRRLLLDLLGDQLGGLGGLGDRLGDLGSLLGGASLNAFPES
jgi:hypothetical protein